jgi:Glycerophosphoryl diester phosphodiesterase family
VTTSAPRTWGGFTHLTPYRRNNSLTGLRHAARNTKAIDLDVQVTKDGVIVCTHWSRPMLRDGFRDPLGRLRRTRSIESMTWKQVKRLRSKDGHRIRTLHWMLNRAQVLSLKRVEIEAKDSRALGQPDTWAPVAQRGGGLTLVVKTISNLPNRSRAGRRMWAAHSMGLTTMLLPRGVRRMSRKWEPYIDYVRGSVRWVK